MNIEEGCVVVLKYEVYDAEGELVESSEDEEVEFVHGSGEVLPGLERALAGHAAGDELKVDLAPEDAFGDYKPEGIITVPRAELPADAELTAGEFITIVVSDDDDSAEDDEEIGEIDVRIVEAGDEEVVLDANHPLAGQNVTFQVKVVSVRPSDG